MNIEQIYLAYLKCTNVVIDNRKVEAGSFFVALKGDRFDANQFALAAIEAGASFALVSDESVAKSNPSCILVNDTLIALQELAKYHRSQLRYPVLALTGSNGKTTTKELTNAVLSKKYKTTATIGNLNNHIGVPLTILNTKQDTDFLIVEMGANHQGEIDMLCRIAKPDYVMITNIGKAHLEGFGGIDGVKKGKSEMYRYAQADSKFIFINEDDEILTSLVPTNSLTIPYKQSDLALLKIENEEYLSFTYENYVFNTQLYGEYNLGNMAFAIAAGRFFGVEMTEICDATCGYVPENNRSEIKKIGSNEFICDAYNANPSSMAESLKSFARHNAINKMAILGDMLELGDYALVEHQKIVTLTQELGLTKVYFVGPIFMSVGNGSAYYANIEDAKKAFEALKLENYTILLKGSRGIAVEKILV